MRMITFAANQMRDIENEIRAKGITKDQIVNVFQANDGTFLLIYYGE